MQVVSAALPREPILFRRLAKEAVWGGRALVERLQLQVDEQTRVGETWELSDYPGSTTAIRGGSLDGQELQDVLAQHRDALLGESRLDAQGRFPLLVKLIDAQQDLSVQVHPADGMLEPDGIGKTEAWYILPQSAPSARIIAGFTAAARRPEVERDAATSKITAHLRETAVSGGDCVLIEAGTPHSIRAGTLLVEVQQTSDTTLRMYDWGRVGLDGLPRKTHVEQALRVLDYERPAPTIQRASPPAVEGAAVELSELVRCDYFRLHEVFVRKVAHHQPDGFVRILIVLEGEGTIQGPEGAARAVGFGDTVLLPAHLGDAKVVPGPAGLRLLEAVAL